MKKFLPYFLFSLCLITLPAAGQQDGATNNNQDEQAEEESNAEETEGPKRFWQASLSGGEYMVALDRISSISMHQYVLDAQLLVTELVIDTNGRALARFYHVTSVAEDVDSAVGQAILSRGADLLDRAGQKAGTDVHNLAQKNYPTTSHAGMIEYRVLHRQDLKAIFNSAKSAWESGKGRKITVRD